MHNQISLEQEILDFWKKEKIYQKSNNKNKNNELFFFCDGPPYATGQIHPGTAWNKCLKDSVCRYKRMCGKSVRAQPGYDTHGLPIEVKVEQELQITSKKEIEERVGVEKFINKCRDFATRHISLMSSQFERCGVWMDFDSPYITYKDNYIESSWATIKRAYERGLLSRGLYVLPYCARCETTLANYELEYEEDTDPSIYVKFKLQNSDEYLVIWTTTPWTLISNMAVMVHPTLTYVKAKVNGEIWIIAKERLDAVMAFANSSAIIIGEFSGKKLEGLKYEHPLQKKIGKEYERKVVLSDEFVSVEDGSGLVHCAPGHGPQDFIIGKRFDIEIFSPLDSAGKFTSQAGAYAGKKTNEVEEEILSDLENSGCLIYAGKMRHRYPHCWRCKTKLIYLATEQWFITINKLKDRMLEEIEECKWQPPFAKLRFIDFVRAAPDWCISRQRYWGIPLPIWVCKDCSAFKVIGSLAELGVNINDLHKPKLDKIELDCEKCSGKMKRTPDILDVWFDSGNAVWAQFEGSEYPYPAHLIIEGKDQIRGWFYSLLGSGIVLKDKIPYASVLMHGFFVDEKGEKMSKSLGNFVQLEEIIGKYGADPFRLWCLSSTIWEDLRFSWDEIREASRDVGILYNLGIYLQRFYPESKIPFKKPTKPEDIYILSRLESTAKECTEAFEEYRIHDAVKAIRRFIVEDISHFYLKLIKKRDDEEALSYLYGSVLGAITLASPIIPFTCEAVYQNFFRRYEKEESVHLRPWYTADDMGINRLIERRVSIVLEIIAAATHARQKAGIKLRWPLEEMLIWSENSEVKDTTVELSQILSEMANVKKVSFAKPHSLTFSLTINYEKINEEFKQNAQWIIDKLKKADPEVIESELLKNGMFVLEKYKITKEMVSVAQQAAEGYAISSFDDGIVYIKTKMSRQLMCEAMIREVARRVQIERKKLGLVEKNKISLEISCSNELRSMLEEGREHLATQVNASSLEFSKDLKNASRFEIDGEIVLIRITRL